MGEKLRILGCLEDTTKNDIAEEFVQELVERYPNITGELYLGYPIYIDDVANQQTCVDLALISKMGVFIINIITSSITNYGSIQDDIYAKVDNKFRKCPFLFKKRNLIFNFHAITYTTTNIAEDKDYPLAKNINDLLAFIDTNKEIVEFDNDKFNKILSGIQEAYGINVHKDRENVKEGTKAFAISQMKTLIDKYDSKQMEAILSDSSGIQRIRGMAGSGKTIVLARKAVELHTAHPEWNIVVTYSTRTLKQQLVSLIGRFYAAKNDGAKYNEDKLRVMQSWGSANAKGVYYEICLRHGLTPLNVRDARSKYGYVDNLFSKICEDTLIQIKEFHKMYDCILIDEAQDFDKNYLQLCLKVLGNDERLVYAYDELQKLNEEAMPSPMEIFGKDINYDTPLTVCYRNQGNAIVTAHAIGMGLYSEKGLLQLPSSSSVWQAIGYTSDTDITEGKPVTLYRTKETSPELLKIDPNEIIDFIAFNNENEMYKSLLDMLKTDIETEQLLPRDIMIIDMDAYNYPQNKMKLSAIQRKENYKVASVTENEYDEEKELYKFIVHIAGAASPEDFFRDHSIVYSSVRRAKGNETYVVYIVNAHKCINSLQRRSERNGLFTAITRSKGWVRVLGYGEDMHTLKKEFDEIKGHEYKLYFKEYPDKEKQKEIFLNEQDIDDKDAKALSKTKQLIEKLTVDGNISKLQIMQELLGLSKEEIIDELFNQNGKE